MSNNSINPNFKTSAFWGLIPLTTEEILTKLKDDFNIFRTFKRYGIINSKEYPFITKITFSTYEKNCIEGLKNEDEKLQAIQNLKVVEDYFNCYQQGEGQMIKVAFAERNDNECAIYNPDRFNYDALQIKLKEIFD